MHDMAANQDRVTAIVTLGGREIEVYEPAEEQVFVLAQIGRMTNGDAKVAFRGLGLFGGVLDALIAHEADLDWAYHQLTTAAIGLDEYLQLVPAIVKAFNIDLPTEDDGPRRPVSRAQAVTKRPAARRR